MKFWDSSAVVPLLLEEPTSEWLIGVLEEDATMVVWWVVSFTSRPGAAPTAFVPPWERRLRRDGCCG